MLAPPPPHPPTAGDAELCLWRAPTTGTSLYGGAPPGGRCSPDEAEVPLPSHIPQLKPRPGQAAPLPPGALSGPLSACVCVYAAGRPAVGRTEGGWQCMTGPDLHDTEEADTVRSTAGGGSSVWQGDWLLEAIRPISTATQ